MFFLKIINNKKRNMTMKYLKTLSAISVITALASFPTYATQQTSHEIGINTPQFKGTFLATILHPTVCSSQCSDAIKVSAKIHNHIATCATTDCQAINITEHIPACANCSIQFQKI